MIRSPRSLASRRWCTRTREGRAELLARGFDPAVVDKVLALVDRAEWKRRQYPPGTKVTALAFGRDRRLPITTRWREP